MAAMAFDADVGDAVWPAETAIGWVLRMAPTMKNVTPHIPVVEMNKHIVRPKDSTRKKTANITATVLQTP